jgi:glutamyl-tRNA reductase
VTKARPAIVALVAHARSVPVAQREALGDAVLALGLPIVLIRTCHRVEVYAASEAEDDARKLAPLAALAPPGASQLSGEDAIRHAVRVAVGRDSVVLGEDQVLHQLRVAVDEARADGRLPAPLERMFAGALRAGRRSRSWLPDRPRSLADRALEAIARESGEVLQGREVLVVGAGRMGTLAARAAARAGASVVVANRTDDLALTLARSVGGRVTRLDPGTADRAPAAVVLAIHGRWAIAGATVDHLVRGGTWIADLSVPPAVDPAAAAAFGARLIDADRLASADLPAAEPDDAWTRRVDRLVEETTGDVVGWLARSSARDAARALRERADRERRAELDVLYRHRPGLDPADREAIEQMAAHLADRLLRAPLERLGQDAEGDAGRAVRELFAL